MPKKIKLKTRANKKSVASFIAEIPDEKKRKAAKKIDKLMREVTGAKPVMWGPSIVGYGSFEYKRSNGDYGDFMATGFSPRKNALTFYILPGYQDYSSMLKKLGPHSRGKSCLYIKDLDQIDLLVLKKLVKTGLKDLRKTHKVSM